MRLADAVSARSRRRKLRLFLDEIEPGPETTVLDIGVDEIGYGEPGGQGACGTHNFFEELYPWPGQITALGLHDGRHFCTRYPDIAYVQGDACALPFADRTFDVAFSNAVVEHVGSRERQAQFVAEAARVARRVFVTTPNRWFPVEVHTMLPLVHWLPDNVAHRVYELTGRGYASSNRLLGPAELRGLFAGPVRIVNLGMTLVAVA
jgi:SAM-dependent methyltransferase